MKPILTSFLILATSLIAQAQAEKSAPPVASDAVRLTVELNDGSRLLGSPLNDSFPWKSGLGPLTLDWNRLRSVERAGNKDKFSLSFRNDDHVAGTPEASVFMLRTMLGDLAIPLELTRRIGVQVTASGSGPVAYWSFNDPEILGADDSGHEHILTVKGALSTDGRFGKAAATRENKGEANYLIIDNHPDLQFSGDFTLAVWAWRSAPIYDGDQLIGKEGEFSLGSEARSVSPTKYPMPA